MSGVRLTSVVAQLARQSFVMPSASFGARKYPEDPVPPGRIINGQRSPAAMPRFDCSTINLSVVGVTAN